MMAVLTSIHASNGALPFLGPGRIALLVGVSGGRARDFDCYCEECR